MVRLIGVLLVVGFVLNYLWWIALAAGIVIAVKVATRLWVWHQAGVDGRRAEQRAIAARADEQHRWVLDDDERGLYGEYPPAV
jgi:hypothetical protein